MDSPRAEGAAGQDKGTLQCSALQLSVPFVGQAWSQQCWRRVACGWVTCTGVVQLSRALIVEGTGRECSKVESCWCNCSLCVFPPG